MWWPFNRKRAETRTTATLHYLIPDENDVALTPRESFVSGLNLTGRCGTHRQKIIAKCRRGEPIFLVRQPNNPHDSNAVILYRQDGTDIGYLPKEMAAEIAPRLDQGSPVRAVYTATETIYGKSGEPLLAPRLILTPYKLKRAGGKKNPAST
jgi:HIRAN domain